MPRPSPPRSATPPRASAPRLRLTLAAIAVLFLAAAARPEISGRVTAVHDGDTFSIGAVDVRVFGIDAPELAQACGDRPCGRDARAALSDLVLGRDLTCRIRGRSFGRLVGECSADGTAIGPAMLARGEAVAYRAFLRKRDGAYLAAEAQARAAGAGIWSGPFVPPAEFRKRGRARRR